MPALTPREQEVDRTMRRALRNLFGPYVRAGCARTLARGTLSTDQKAVVDWVWNSMEPEWNAQSENQDRGARP